MTTQPTPSPSPSASGLPTWAQHPPLPEHTEPWLLSVQALTLGTPASTPLPAQRTLHCLGEAVAYLDDEPEWQALVQVSLAYQPQAAGFTLLGQVRGELLRYCDVCLTPYTTPVAFALEECYGLATLANHQFKERQLDTSTDWYEEVDPKGTVDVAHLVQQLLLAQVGFSNLCPLHADKDPSAPNLLA